MQDGARRQRLCVLGATGSVGMATLDVAGRHHDRFEIFALTANRRLDELFAQCVRFRPRYAVVTTAAEGRLLAEGLRSRGSANDYMNTASALC